MKNTKPNQGIVIDFPLRGEWVFLRPPGHHANAFDFVKANENRKKYSKGNLLNFIFNKVHAENFYCWSKPVFAPIDGEVIQACNDWPDNKSVNLVNTLFIWFRATFLFKPERDSSKIDIRPNAGNYVMIQAESGYIVFIAHMRSSSVKVNIGQKVSSGDMIGEVGNSGNSTMPHLHINLFDQMDEPLKANVLPFLFSSYEQLEADGTSWKAVNNSVPKVPKALVRI